MTAQICSEACPLCDAMALECMTRSRDFDQDSVQFHVDGLEYAVCRECGGQTTTIEQSRRNKRRVIAAHKAAAGLLSGEQIRNIRVQRLGGVSQQVMASVLGVGVNTFSRYETDSVVQSDSMNSLLVVLDAHPEAFQTLAKRRGVMVSPAKASYAGVMGLLAGAATRYESHHTELIRVMLPSGGGDFVKLKRFDYARATTEEVL